MAQKTDVELNAEADVIANETVAGANTKTRVANLNKNIIDSKPNNSVITTLQGEVDGTETVANAAAAAAVAAQTNIDTHEALTNNPHSVTKSQVGLSNVDNTADTDKPVSTAQATAMSTTNKVLITGTTVLDNTAWGKVHIISGTSADYTVTLPTAVGSEGKMILFQGDPDPVNFNKTVTIDGDGTEKINNSLNYAISTGGTLSVMARVTSGIGNLDIVNFDQGAYINWTPTFAPYTVQPTVAARYKRGIGTLFIIITTSVSGTATAATTLTFDLPGGFTSVGNQRGIIPQFTNNNVASTTPGVIGFNGSSNTVNCYTNGQLAAWSGANGRGISGMWQIFINE